MSDSPQYNYPGLGLNESPGIQPEFIARFSPSLLLENFTLSPFNLSQSWNTLGFSKLHETTATGRSGRAFVPESFLLSTGTIHEKQSSRQISAEEYKTSRKPREDQDKLQEQNNYSVGHDSFSTQKSSKRYERQSQTALNENSKKALDHQDNSTAADGGSELKKDFNRSRNLNLKNLQTEEKLPASSGYETQREQKNTPHGVESIDSYRLLKNRFSPLQSIDLSPLPGMQDSEAINKALESNSELQSQMTRLQKEYEALKSKELELVNQLQEALSLQESFEEESQKASQKSQEITESSDATTTKANETHRKTSSTATPGAELPLSAEALEKLKPFGIQPQEALNFLQQNNILPGDKATEARLRLLLSQMKQRGVTGAQEVNKESQNPGKNEQLQKQNDTALTQSHSKNQQSSSKSEKIKKSQVSGTKSQKNLKNEAVDNSQGFREKDQEKKIKTAKSKDSSPESSIQRTSAKLQDSEEKTGSKRAKEDTAAESSNNRTPSAFSFLSHDTPNGPVPALQKPDFPDIASRLSETANGNNSYDSPTPGQESLASDNKKLHGPGKKIPVPGKEFKNSNTSKTEADFLSQETAFDQQHPNTSEYLSSLKTKQVQQSKETARQPILQKKEHATSQAGSNIEASQELSKNDAGKSSINQASSLGKTDVSLSTTGKADSINAAEKVAPKSTFDKVDPSQSNTEEKLHKTQIAKNIDQIQKAFSNKVSSLYPDSDAIVPANSEIAQHLQQLEALLNEPEKASSQEIAKIEARLNNALNNQQQSDEKTFKSQTSLKRTGTRNTSQPEESSKQPFISGHSEKFNQETADTDLQSRMRYLQHLKQIYAEQFTHKGQFKTTAMKTEQLPGLKSGKFTESRDSSLNSFISPDITSTESRGTAEPFLSESSSLASPSRPLRAPISDRASRKAARTSTQAATVGNLQRPPSSLPSNKASLSPSRKKSAPVKIKVGRVTYRSDNNVRPNNEKTFKRPGPQMSLQDYEKIREANNG